MSADRACRSDCRRLTFDEPEQGLAIFEPGQRQIRRQLELVYFEIRIIGIPIHLKGIVRGPQEPRILPRQLDDVVHHMRQGDMRRNVLPARRQPAQGRAVTGKAVGIVTE